jgi:hypothetical protein
LLADGHGGGGLDFLLHVKHRSGSFFFLKKANPIFFCFFMFVNLRDGEKNPKKQIPKKEDKKKAKTSGQTDGQTDKRTNGRTNGRTDGRTDTERGCRIGLADYRVRTCRGRQRPVLPMN